MSTIDYSFSMEKAELSYAVNIDRADSSKTPSVGMPEWVQLDHNKCTNCPLTSKDHPCCPAAVDLKNVIDDFQTLPATTKAMVKVSTKQRQYAKQTSLEEGVRALIGVVMASSGCPILSNLKPLVKNHLPFTSQEEYITRMVSSYLLQQYFKYKDGQQPDWDLQGLIEANKQLQLVNHAFWQRIYPICEKDSNIKAFLSFFALSSSVSQTLDAQLQKIKPQFTLA
jgi:hypothetical protein